MQTNKSESNDPSDEKGPALDRVRMEAICTSAEIRCEFLRVPQLSKMLGISANSIHSQIRLGIFPVPHRRVGNVIVVKREDYIRWFEEVQVPRESKAVPKREPARTEAPQPLDEGMLGRATVRVLAGLESASERKEREKQEVLTGLRAKGFAL